MRVHLALWCRTDAIPSESRVSSIPHVADARVDQRKWETDHRFRECGGRVGVPESVKTEPLPECQIRYQKQSGSSLQSFKFSGLSDGDIAFRVGKQVVLTEMWFLVEMSAK